jgi:hypothetical protein
LPHFSWHNNPKIGVGIPINYKIYQMAIKIPNGHKIHEMAIKYYNIFNSKAPQKFTKIVFWSANTSSGNPCLGFAFFISSSGFELVKKHG